jgi:hypothetical protein
VVSEASRICNPTRGKEIVKNSDKINRYDTQQVFCTTRASFLFLGERDTEKLISNKRYKFIIFLYLLLLIINVLAYAIEGFV